MFPDSEQLDPLTVSTVSVTARPDDADAVTGNDCPGWGDGGGDDVKTIDCGALATVITCCMRNAAA